MSSEFTIDITVGEPKPILRAFSRYAETIARVLIPVCGGTGITSQGRALTYTRHQHDLDECRASLLPEETVVWNNEVTSIRLDSVVPAMHMAILGHDEHYIDFDAFCPLPLAIEELAGSPPVSAFRKRKTTHPDHFEHLAYTGISKMGTSTYLSVSIHPWIFNAQRRPDGWHKVIARLLHQVLGSITDFKEDCTAERFGVEIYTPGIVLDQQCSACLDSFGQRINESQASRGMRR